MDIASLLRQEPLDKDVERTWARATRDGDRESRDRLVRASLRLVALRVVALGVVGPRVDDALQDGTEGLLRAVDRFEPDRGTSLATYAWPWITGAILRGLEGPRAHLEESDQVPAEEAGPDGQGLLLDVERALAQLPGPQAEVVRLRFGLASARGVPLSRRRVAAALGTTETRVRRLEDQAVRHLRRSLATVGDRASPSGEADPL